MLDKYFKNPVLIDFVISSLIAAFFFLFVNWCYLIIPKEELLLSIATDISNISFTSAGFVLTFLTLLVSFKISSNPVIKKEKSTLEETYNKVTIFNLFLNSPLYTETIKHLKNGVKELLVIAIIGYGFKLLTNNIDVAILFYFNIIGIVIVALVLWRSLLVLSGVLSVQDKDGHNLEK